MFALGALAVSTVDVAFFTPPPRPQRPERRSTRSADQVRGFVRALRRTLALAAADGNGFPRTRRYPY